ncbi:C-type lectin domain family 4 member G [Lates calcarifer]|uniref:C-type lectin domain family 4 member G n=1 Tax=Lates calcarifer TaxID=8187 RepID=A0AAJ7Q320_LATCA|nr:C-type lectin domain family 4 member G [Lates calcarifer]
MILDGDHNTDGKLSHQDTRRKGSTLVVVCLGLLNTILLLTAVVIGIYCGKVSEESSSIQVKAQALIIEVEQLRIIQSEAIKALKEAEQALKKELKIHQQLKLQLEKNKTVNDGLQRQIETLRMETETLLSNSSIARTSCGRCPPGWFLSYGSCYFHSRSASSPPRNWADSRADCISRGADLAVIPDWDEQLHLFDKMPKLGATELEHMAKFSGYLDWPFRYSNRRHLGVDK